MMLSLDTAYRSFGGEVEASSTPTICRLPDSRRHQLSAIARGAHKTALLNFVRSGRGFLGVHSATDTFYTWPDYLELVGGYFNGHPWHQAVTIEVVDPGDPLLV